MDPKHNIDIEKCISDDHFPGACLIRKYKFRNKRYKKLPRLDLSIRWHHLRAFDYPKGHGVYMSHDHRFIGYKNLHFEPFPHCYGSICYRFGKISDDKSKVIITEVIYPRWSHGTLSDCLDTHSVCSDCSDVSTSSNLPDVMGDSQPRASGHNGVVKWLKDYHRLKVNSSDDDITTDSRDDDSSDGAQTNYHANHTVRLNGYDNTAAQMNQYEAPHHYQPVAPHMHYPVAPNMHQPEAPNMHQPEAPHMHQPEAPHMHQPVASHFHQPVASHMHQPVASHMRQPVASHMHQPVASNMHQPVASHMHQPVASNMHQPVAPRMHQPVAPRMHQPLTHHMHQPGAPYLQQSVGPHMYQTVGPHMHQPVGPYMHQPGVFYHRAGLNQHRYLHQPVTPQLQRPFTPVRSQVLQPQRILMVPRPVVTQQQSPQSVHTNDGRQSITPSDRTLRRFFEGLLSLP